MILVCFMKIFSTIFTEFVNILLISTETKTIEIVKDFVALTIIAELDSLYALTIKGNTIRDRVDGKVLYIDKTKKN